MELLTMAVLLKNLTARNPNTEDLAAITELVGLCENSENGMAGSTLEELLSEWQRPDFHLANDAWVIVTTRGQFVGFACVWHEEHTRISNFLCVHPDYRNRGIGTLLLRMVEVRARQHVRLFEREGYQAGRPFLRISFTLPEESGQQPAVARRLKVDVGLEHQGRLSSASPLSDQDALCSVTLYRTYEKELRPAQSTGDAQTDLQVVGA